jgi:hypothetical protein
MPTPFSERSDRDSSNTASLRRSRPRRPRGILHPLRSGSVMGLCHQFYRDEARRDVVLGERKALTTPHRALALSSSVTAIASRRC